MAAAREMPVMEQVNGQEGSGLCLEKLVGSLPRLTTVRFLCCTKLSMQRETKRAEKGVGPQDIY